MGLEWTGIKYPFCIENGSVGKTTSAIGAIDGKSEHINNSIEIIIKTTIGEWITNNGIGNKLRKFVFENFDDGFDSYLCYTLTEAIESQDNRVSIVDIDVRKNKDESKVIVKVSWDYNKDVVKSNDTNTYETETTINI